ncbi:IS1096 element passenger TnpR family protein [Schleiferilactobacillus perolens]|uniref:Plasmid pRiA4b Orf3-like domain-containing protein n=1 Tax=Schleiferilactobacillus perolens DSM 12744 TaxID=1423792 RepID=A0A0R1MPW8_9LACO|nr:DUF2785 domain-containing protein [Schleiferilactobacillus perolens]KRL09983.1 hypothetical protein FD09_GL001026 [Schleiferilactobacillus perolens DSM 12744]
MAEKKYLQLKIQIDGVHPPVWRQVVVPETVRLNQLHGIIQIAFGWQNGHLHSFQDDQNKRRIYVDAIDPDTTLEQELTAKTAAYPLLQKGPLVYTYDFGDDWQHTITLEKTLSPLVVGAQQVPFCVAGRGPNRVEDSRGVDTSGNGVAGAHFNKKKINAALIQAFPTENADPDLTELADQQEPTGSVREAVTDPDQLQADALAQLLGGDIGKDDLADPEDFSSAAVTVALQDIHVADEERRLQAQFVLVVGLTEGFVTTAQRKRIAQEIVTKEDWLFEKIDQPQNDAVYTRSQIAIVGAALLHTDIVDPFLTAKERNQLFDWAVRYVQAEQDMRQLKPAPNTATSAGLRFLYAAVMHPRFPAKKRNQLANIFLAVLNHLQTPFLGDESEAMAVILTDLARSKQLSPKKMLDLLDQVSQQVDPGIEDDRPETFYRERAWQSTLYAVFFGLMNVPGYQDSHMLIFSLITSYLTMMGMSDLDDDDDDDLDDDGDEDDYPPFDEE